MSRANVRVVHNMPRIVYDGTAGKAPADGANDTQVSFTGDHNQAGLLLPVSNYELKG